MVKAIEAVKNGGYSFYKASIEFNIPRSTLIRQWKDNKLTKNKIGRKRVLTPEQEDILAGRIKRIVDMNYPVTPGYLRSCVYKFCEENNIKTNFSKNKETAGSYWLKYFLQRYPDIIDTNKKKCNLSSTVEKTRFIVKEFYNKLHEVLINNGIFDKPLYIYNIEFKVIKINLATGLANLRDSYVQQTHTVDDEEVKVICAGNASGQFIPPMTIFKGNTLKNKWCKDFPVGAIARVTSDGSVTSDAFNEWLKHFHMHRNPGPCLLTFNSDILRLDYNTIQLADQLGITVFCLPQKNSIHYLRPICKGCFKAFDKEWEIEIQEFWKIFNLERDAFKAFSKRTFGQVLTAVWTRAMTRKNIMSGFADTGLYPWKPEVVLKESQENPSTSTLSSSIEVEEI